MSKVFRIYKEGTDTYQGWNENPAFPYNSTARDSINDPDGASARNEITSIPSPFARIDLVKTAFREVCKLASQNIQALDGQTIFHKMVSDTLDIGEIFFNIDKLRDKVEIITWVPDDGFKALRESAMNDNPGHLYVADALEKYMKSDARTYNFDQMQNMYLLNYKNGPDQLNIIGATSPATLFFSGANRLDYVNDIFFANNDRPFDDEYQPLYLRDTDYIKAWWTLKTSILNFTSLFPEIEDYLTLTYRAITDPAVKAMLNSVSQASVNDFSSIDVQNNQQTNQVEVLGHNLLKKKAGEVGTSQFTIKPTATVEDAQLPLVLPVEAGNKYATLAYVNGQWGKTNKAPYKDNQADPALRTLPFDGAQFPYLTVCDFLEDTIIRVPHALNKRFYWDGGVSLKDQSSAFLLPIKPLYFKYFSADTLQSLMPDGRAAFGIEELAGGSVLVSIRIPIAGNNTTTYIEYQRMYYANRQADISDVTNDGGMTTFDFSGLVMPSVKFQSAADAFYTVACVSTFSSQYKLDFYLAGRQLQNITPECRNQTQGVFAQKADVYTIEHQTFDCIRVGMQGKYAGILLPTFKEHQSIETFEFAIDLGTSNTHIEYKKSGPSSQSEAFAYNADDGLQSTFFLTTYQNLEGKVIQKDFQAESQLLEKDFLPTTVHTGEDFSFPTRTALSCAKTTDWTRKQNPFGMTNLYLAYDKRRDIGYNDQKVNIKWSNEPNAECMMQAYIESLMLMLRAKVVAGNGNIGATRITWFYPNSMSPRRVSQLHEAWDNTYHRFFSPNASTQRLSESVAPIQFYFRRYATATNLVNIDIGGGTTDIAFSTGGKVQYVTSFKFAANALFEDALSDINPSNGIVDHFREPINELLKSSGLSELSVVYERNVGHPANMASFLFSLKDLTATKNLAQNSIDFNRILQGDTSFKIVFIIFYTAIVYHVAQIVKAKHLSVPRHIAFSGNGSKLVKIVSSDQRILSQYTRLVFEQVLGQDYGQPLDILGTEQDSNPKEATGKGGLIAANSTADTFETLVMRDSSGRFVSKGDKYSSLSEEDKTSMTRTVEAFFGFTLKQMPKVFNFDANFGVSRDMIDIALTECRKDLATYLDKGISLSVKESGSADNDIEDALSFYPIKGVMQALSTEIYNHLQ